MQWCCSLDCINVAAKEELGNYFIEIAEPLRNGGRNSFEKLRENKIWVGNSGSSCWLVWTGETARCLPGLSRSSRWRLAIDIDFKIAEKSFCLQQDKYSLCLAMNWLVWSGETARCLTGLSRSPKVTLGNRNRFQDRWKILHIWPYLSYLGAYLSAPNMVKWGVPEKILQNAVQTCWS